MRLGVYYEGVYTEELTWVCETLHKQFLMLDCVVIGSLDLPRKAWDTFKGQFDVHYLLDYLEIAEDTELSLWVVNQDIGDPGHLFLFGAAGKQKAIVSKARLEHPADIAKEACHEVGHLLGLGHCTNDCLMRVSWSSRAVEQKNSNLCQKCLTILNISKEE